MNASSIIKSDLTVNMSDVVSIFVSKYEDRLYEQKGQLQTQLTDLKKNQTALNDELIAEMKRKYAFHEFVNEQTGLSAKILRVDVRQHECVTVMSVKHTDYSFSYDYTKEDALTGDFLERRHMFVQQIDEVNKKLMEVITNLKNVARKERQVRARIAEQQLEKVGGVEQLLTNEMVVQLIEND